MKATVKPILMALLIVETSLHAMDSDKKHVLVPLEGFLFEVNTKKAISELGSSGTLSAAWTNGLRGSLTSLWGSATGKAPDQTAIAKRLFALLEDIKYQEHDVEMVLEQQPPEVYWRGIKAPCLFVYGWLKSNKSCSDLQSLVMPHIQAQAGRLEKTSLEVTAQIIFDPEKNAAMLQPNQKAVMLLTALRESGHIVHVVDNWNKEAFSTLRQQHQEPFKLINGCLHVSGEKGHVKSANSTAFQDDFLSAHPEIAPENCVVIETESQYITPLSKKKLKHVLVDNGNIEQVRTTLQKIGLLAK